MSTKIPLIVPNRSLFNLSCQNLTTLGFGQLQPTYVRELLPGDHFTIRPSFNGRFLSLLAPIMHQLDLHNSFFFVPYRLLWSNWEDFISPKEFLSTEGPAAPFLLFSGLGSDTRYQGTLMDYLDMLPNVYETERIQKTSPFRVAAYRKIWNDFYRDQNLQDEIPFELIDGDNSTRIAWDTININHYKCLSRAMHSDYFTSALPWTQKGNPVFIPFGVNIDMNASSVRLVPLGLGGQEQFPVQGNGSQDVYGMEVMNSSNLNTVSGLHFVHENGINQPVRFMIEGTSPRLFSELFKITGISASAGNGTATINDLRTALALQRWLERNARGGTRYVEYIFAHFGVISPDARLQRAEFVGGSVTPLQISEVLQTSGTSEDAGSPLGTPAGSAYTSGSPQRVSYHAREHGIIMCLTSLTYRNMYASGQDRDCRKFDRFDYFTPSFQNIGEQEVFVTELGRQDANDPDKVFGYAPRYEEYRVAFDRIHGELRKSLDFWHLGRRFDEPAVLNSSFIQANNPSLTDRIFPYSSEEYVAYKQFLLQMYFNVKALRPVPKHGIPSIL